MAHDHDVMVEAVNHIWLHFDVGQDGNHVVRMSTESCEESVIRYLRII
jgi:hypothetical protein